MEKASDSAQSGEPATAADGGVGGGEEDIEMDVDELLRELLDTVEKVRSFSEYRRTQRKECYNLIRRMKLAVPLLEEIRDLEIPVPGDVCAKLYSLRTAFTAAKKLLRCCHDGSRIYLGDLGLNRIWSLEEQHASTVSVVKALKLELEHARAQIQGETSHNKLSGRGHFLTSLGDNITRNFIPTSSPMQ